MRSQMMRFMVWLALVMGTAPVFAQYYGERVMEKSFEQTDFFFRPAVLSPYGIGGFQSIAVGLIDDPLTNLALNPSLMRPDTVSNHSLYLDFRSVSDIRSQPTYGYGVISYRTTAVYDWMPYPRYFVETRKELQPTFSAAYFMRPLPGLLPGLAVGASYQMIFQDDTYYNIPHDIYRSVVGYDFTGARASADALPIVDRYKGSDHIHHVGHFASAFGALSLIDAVSVGMKVSRVTFNRDGAFGSQNFWSNHYNPGYSSLWGNMETREQVYGHWDAAGGVRFGGSEEYVGLTAGMLWGDADQRLTRTDTSFYGFGTVNSGTSWSHYMRSGLTNQHWDHDGTTQYGTLQLRGRSGATKLNLVYGIVRQNVDISLASLISDTSFSSYRHQYDSLYYLSEGFSRLLDERSGFGNKTSTAHRLLLSWEWHSSEELQITLGLQVEMQDSETDTDESVKARSGSEYTSSGSWNYSSYHRSLEEKNLIWSFRTRVRTLHIPVLFQWRASDWFEAFFGFSRTMSSWEIDDVTLAVIHLRDRQNSWGDNEHDVNFGERYTMPKERVSDVKTSALLGLTARPSHMFSIRLLATPNIVTDFEGTHIQDIRWWLSFGVTP